MRVVGRCNPLRFNPRLIQPRIIQPRKTEPIQPIDSAVVTCVDNASNGITTEFYFNYDIKGGKRGARWPTGPHPLAGKALVLPI